MKLLPLALLCSTGLCWYKTAESAKTALENGSVDPTKNNSTVLILSVLDNNTEVVELLLRDGRAKPTASDSLALATAVENGNAKIVKLLLQDGRANPRSNNSLPFRMAVNNGDVEVVKLFLEDGRVDASIDDYQPFISASTLGHSEVVRLLVGQDGSDIPAKTVVSAIKAAFDHKHYKTVGILIDVCRENNFLKDLFNKACLSRQPQLAKKCLEKAIIPPTEMKEIVRKAVNMGNTTMVQTLLQDPRVDPADAGTNLFQVAATNGNSNVIELLLKDGRADPSIDAANVISSAILDGELHCASLLLNDPRVLGLGNAPIDLGRYAENKSMAMMLEARDLREALIHLMKEVETAYINEDVDVTDLYNCLEVARSYAHDLAHLIAPDSINKLAEWKAVDTPSFYELAKIVCGILGQLGFDGLPDYFAGRMQTIRMLRSKGIPKELFPELTN